MRSHSPALERPGPVPDRIRYAQPPETMDQPGPAQRQNVCSSGRPSLRPASSGQGGDRDRMAERERRLQVHEVRDGRQRAVKLPLRQFYGQRRARKRSRSCHAGTASRPPKYLLRLGAQQRGQGRIELPARSPAGERRRTFHAAYLVSYLHELRELRDPGCYRNRFGPQVAWPAPPSHCSYARTDRLTHLVRTGQVAQPASAPASRAATACR